MAHAKPTKRSSATESKAPRSAMPKDKNRRNTEDTQAGLTPADLADLLTPIARKGLPATAVTAGQRLPRLRDVLAYSAQPESLSSRIAALNEVLKEILRDGEHEYAEAARRLFALELEERGTTLEHRDSEAAKAVSVSPGHFRQRIRARVIRAVAEDLFAHARRYQSAVRSPRAQRISGDRPSFTPDSFTDEQQVIARIWQHLYGWRAETIAAVRLATHRGRRDEFELCADRALREYGWLHQAKSDWIDKFAEQRINAGIDGYDAEGIVRLATWAHLTVDDTTIVRLATARTTSDGLRSFRLALQRSSEGQRILRHWRSELRALARASSITAAAAPD